MTITELLESERADLLRLRRLRDKHPNDAETQRLVGELIHEKAERMVWLNELLQYRDSDKKVNEDKADDSNDRKDWPTPWG